LVEFKADLPRVKVSGFLTKTIISGSMASNSKISKEQTYFYLNKRPVDMPLKVKQLLSDIYK